MLREWERQYPGRSDNMLRAMAHVTPSHLMDRNLYPFATLQATGVADAAGDKAFDDETMRRCRCRPTACQLALERSPAACSDSTLQAAWRQPARAGRLPSP